MNGSTTRDDVGEYLARWVTAGLLTADQAARIRRAELTGAVAAAGTERTTGRRPHGSPLVVEALGYLGAALTALAGFIAITQLWPDVPTGVQLTFAAAGAVSLGSVAAALRRRAEPAFGRLRAILWLLSTASVAAFVGLLTSQLWHFTDLSSVLGTAVVTTGYAGVVWWHARTPVQHVVMFGGGAVTVGVGVAWLGTDTPLWASGVAVWLFAALWAVAVRRGYLPPRAAGYLAAAVGLLVGAQLTMEAAAGHLLALATVATLLAGGVVLRTVWLVAIGAVGTVLVVPITATRYLPENLGAPLAVFVAGVVLLGAALWLARRPWTSSDGRPARP